MVHGVKAVTSSNVPAQRQCGVDDAGTDLFALDHASRHASTGLAMGVYHTILECNRMIRMSQYVFGDITLTK